MCTGWPPEGKPFSVERSVHRLFLSWKLNAEQKSSVARAGARLFRNHADVGNDGGVITWLNTADGFKTCKPNS